LSKVLQTSLVDGTDEIPRHFGFWTGWFVVVASMVGSGILTNSGPILKSTGSYPVLFALWAIGGVIALMGALTMGELASGLPRVGGDYIYVREAFGPAWGFTYGWSMVLLGFAAPIALVAYTTASYLYVPLSAWLNLSPGALDERNFILLFATCLIVVFTIVHSLGHRHSSRIQSFTTIFKIGVLIALGLFLFVSARGEWSHLQSDPQFFRATWGNLASGLILVMYAYTGWNAAVYLAGEIRTPRRNLPLCLSIGCLGVTVLYLLLNVAYGYALSVPKVMLMSEVDTNRLAEVAASTLLGSQLSQLFSTLISLGVIASLSAYTLTGPRIVYAMAKDGLFPAPIARLNPRTGTPQLATFLQAGLALIFLWSGTFEQVLTFAGYGLSFVSIMVIAPIFFLRRRSTFHPEFRVPLYPWIPAFFILANVAMLVGAAMDTPGLAVASIGTVLAGFPLYKIFSRFFVRKETVTT